MGINKGWTVIFGGNGGTRPKFGDIIVRNLSAAEALELHATACGVLPEQCKTCERTARFMERVGVDTLILNC
jgi:NAD(P)H-nitrite reductase large subunit